MKEWAVQTRIRYSSIAQRTQNSSNQIANMFCCILDFLGGSDGKESACNAGDLGLIPGQEDPLEEGMAIHSSILACLPLMEKSIWRHHPRLEWQLHGPQFCYFMTPGSLEKVDSEIGVRTQEQSCISGPSTDIVILRDFSAPSVSNSTLNLFPPIHW